MSKSKPEKSRMATIAEIYNRIIWDSRLNRNLFIAGFQERISTKIREKPLAQWDINGDIPWHRIRYIRCGETIVWDREKHLDLISTGDLPPTAWKSTEVGLDRQDLDALLNNNQAIFTSRNVYKSDDRQWNIIEPKLRSNQIDRLTIASYNVLFDLYETETIQTQKRLPIIFEELRQSNADIIALQEATPELVNLLLSQDWVQSYFISESRDGKTVKPYGNLLMSKFPFTLVEHQFSTHKRLLVGTWQFNEESFHLAVVHLTSDRGDNGRTKRTSQLATLLSYLQKKSDTCAIVGDFNIHDDEQIEIVSKEGFIDVWKELHPKEKGYTFDPDRNSLAMLMSLSGKPSRLDRILLRRSGKSHYQPRSIELFGCKPIPDTKGEIFPSDHFGIRGVFDYSQLIDLDLTKIDPVHQSAIVILPPDELFPSIQSIRQRFDRRFTRWMPHITLIYGFLPENYFEAAIEQIAPILSQIQPFTITLADFQTFSHKKNSTAWLRPIAEPEDALHYLQNALQSLFPQCHEQSTKTLNGFTPHLSVGQFASSREASIKLPQWHPLKFQVNSIALISLREDGSFKIRQILKLGDCPKGLASHRATASQTKRDKQPTDRENTVRSSELIQLINKLAPELTPAERSQRETIVSVISQACEECLGFIPQLHLLGSARLLVESPTSDLDLVCLIPNYLEGEVFLENVWQKIKDLCEYSQVVLNAKVPALRLKLEGISLDLLYARVEDAENIYKDKSSLSSLRSQNLDATSLKSIMGCWEADLIDLLVSDCLSFDTFKLMLRGVKAWAKCRHIYGNSWGFLGGFSWTLLCAWCCLNYQKSARSPEALITEFFQALSLHDFKSAIALTDAGKKYQVRLPQDRFPIITSIKPCQNTARNVTRSTAEILKTELARGAEISSQALSGKVSWEKLFEEPTYIPATDEFLAEVVLKITKENISDFQQYKSVLESRIVGLIIHLEQFNISVRTNPSIRSQNNSWRLSSILRKPNSLNIEEIERIGNDFLSQFSNDFVQFTFNHLFFG